MNDTRNKEWQLKLVGKTLIDNKADIDTLDDSKEYVRKKELPKGHRLLPPGTPKTRDYLKDRLNVSLNDDNVIKYVHFG